MLGGLLKNAAVAPLPADDARRTLIEGLGDRIDPLGEMPQLWVEGELDKELRGDHEMAGAAWHAIARAGVKDYLFYCEDGRVALVHLTKAGHRSDDPAHPPAAVMPDLKDALKRLKEALPAP